MFRYLRRSRTSASVQAILDSYFGYTSLLLNGETSATPFNADASTNNLNIAPFGSVHNDQFSPFDGNNYSTLFNGSTDYLSLPANTNLAIGSGDFTIEFWLNAPAQLNTFIYDNRASTVSSYPYVALGTSSPVLRWGPTGLSGTTVIANNLWHHCAVTRQSGTIKLWVDGVLDTSGTDATSYSTNYTTRIGNNSYGGNFLSGFLSNFRIVKGTAVYTSTFTPPTTPLTTTTDTVLLTCQAPQFKDSSTNNFAVTVTGTPKVQPKSPFSYTPSSASAFFNGTTDYMMAPANSQFQLAGNFTVEGWFNISAYPSAATSTLLDQRTTNGNATGIGFYLSPSTGGLSAWSGGAAIFASSTSPSLNAWHHFAYVRSGGTITAYLDGVSVAAAVASANYTDTACRIGVNAATAGYFFGYLSNVRLVNGTAMYTTAFTPPTSPITVVTNTSMLTLQGSGPAGNAGFLDISGSDLSIAKTGTPTQGTFSPFSQSGWSTYFNGTTDSLAVPTTQALVFGTGDFTMEAWVNPVSFAANNSFMGGVSAGAPVVNLNTGTTVTLNPYGSAATVTATYAFALNTWYHIVVTRASGVSKIFINGVLTASSMDATNYSVAVTNVGSIPAAAQWFPGYVSNARVTKGISLYSVNFAPITVPLTAVPGTSLLMCQGNKHADNSTLSQAITISGTPSVQAVSPFEPSAAWAPLTNGGSMYFNGTTDYVSAQASATLAFGTGDFTVEAWVYFNSVAGTYVPICQSDVPGSSSVDKWFLALHTSTLNFGTHSSGSYNASMPWTPSTGQWYHVAAVRSSGVTSLFVNGVAGVMTGGSSGNNYTLGQNGISMGVMSTPFYLNGYLANVRVSRSALYTALSVPYAQFPDVSSTDPYFQYDSLLLHADGANAAQNNVFVDSSANNLTLTKVGSPSQGSKSPFSNSGWNVNFPTASDYVSTANTAATQVGTGDFTIECWAYVPTTVPANVAVLSKNGYSWLIAVSSGSVNVYISTTGSTWDVMNTTIGTISYNTWNHFAITRQGNTVRAFYNGVLGGSATTAGAISDTTFGVYSGYWTSGGATFNGTGISVSNARVLKGTALYTTNFAPPTSALTAVSGTGALLFQSSRFKDNSANNLAITVTGSPSVQQGSPFPVSSSYNSSVNGGSLYFNGTSDYLTVPASTNVMLGAGDFTLECWVNTSGASTTYGYQVAGTYAGSGSGWAILVNRGTGTSGVAFVINGSLLLATSSYLPVNSWNHIAIVRQGTGTNNCVLYVNGVNVTQISYNTADAFSGTLYVGAQGAGGQLYPGYLSNLRIVKSAVYTTSFVPSTAPLTAITNTSFLLSGTNAGIVDNTGKNVLLTTSGAKLSTAVSKFGSASMQFNGTTDGFYMPANTALVFNTGDFTIEMWVYPTGRTVGTLYAMVLGGSTSGIQITVNTTGTVYLADTTAQKLTTTGILALNAWTHLAVVKTSGVVSVYLNGYKDSSVAWANSLVDNTVAGIGYYATGTGSQYFTGYIDEVRITKGVARYTGSFAVPTTPLTTNANTALLLTSANLAIVDATGKNDVNTIAGARTSTVQKKFGSKSMYFNGTTDYLTIPHNPNLVFGSGDFTVECWINTPGTINPCGVWAKKTVNGYGIELTLNPLAPAMVVSVNGTTWGINLSSSISLVANTWAHVAMTRKGNTFSLFVNGALGASATLAGSVYDNSLPFVVGSAQADTTYAFQGYIDDFRFTKGYARYWSGFVPPVQTFGDSSSADPYFNQVSLLLHADGTSYSAPAMNNNLVVDSSYNAATITRVGTPTQATFSPYTTASWSSLFNGSSDYVTVPLASASALTLGTGDFTMEWWQYSTVSSAYQPIMKNSSGSGWANFQWYVSVDATGAFILAGSDGGGAFNYFSGPTGAVVANKWQHIAVVRSSGTWLLFIDGVSKTLASGTGYTSSMEVNTVSQPLNLGGFPGWAPLTGYMSNFRLVKGTALYSAGFTPTTSPLTAVAGTSVLALQSNRFKDNSASNFTLTPSGTPSIQAFSPFSSVTYNPAVHGGSLYFNGSTDYFTAPASSNWIFAGDHTIEAWIYPKTTGDMEIVCTGGSGSSDQFLITPGTGTGKIAWGYAAVGYLTTTANIPINTWTHLAVSRSSSVLRAFVNGVSVYVGNVAATIGQNAVMYIGMRNDVTGLVNGYLSNVRVVNGTALYTSNFAVPTGPLAPVNNTVLLLNGVGAGIVDGTGKNAIVTVSGAATQTSVVKYGTGAMKFNGSTDYLVTSPSLGLAFSGNFTIEAWVYPTAASTSRIVSFANTDEFLLLPANTVSYFDGTVNITSSATVALNTWSHVAVCKVGTTVTVYVNGVASATATSTYTSSAARSATIGRYGPSALNYFPGYIDDLRITNGLARYTANFTAPTAALPDSSATDPYFSFNSLLLQGDIQNVTQNVSTNKVFLDSSANSLAVTATGNPTQGTFSPFGNNAETKGGSIYFNGTTDYLVASNSGTSLSTFNAGDFTIEAWVYTNSLAAIQQIVFLSDGGANNWANHQCDVSILTTGAINFEYATGVGNTASQLGSTSTISVNTWNHIALVASGGVLTFYINGIASGSGSISTFGTRSASYRATVGRTDPVVTTPAYYFNGYISNLRIVKGSAQYPANFTPSTTPLTAVSNAKLLLSGTNGAATDTSGANDVVLAGNAKVSSFSKFGNGSLYLSGANDYATIPSSANLALGTGDFTMEFWTYPTALANGFATLLGFRPAGANGTYPWLYLASGTTLTYYVSTAARITGPVLAVNTWYHIALSRVNGVTKMYVNGVQVGSSYADTTNYTIGASGVTVGFDNAGTGTYYYAGYIDDLRITKGTGRYTADFAVPTAAFPTN
jgi:hypothetical protein